MLKRSCYLCRASLKGVHILDTRMQAPAAVDQARRMVSEGAAIIDVGGQSTRPGAQLLTAEEELQRVLPVIRYITVAVTCRSTDVVAREAGTVLDQQCLRKDANN